MTGTGSAAGRWVVVDFDAAVSLKDAPVVDVEERVGGAAGLACGEEVCEGQFWEQEAWLAWLEAFDRACWVK